MNQQSPEMPIGRRAVIGGALLGGAGAVLASGGAPASAAVRRAAGSRGSEVVPMAPPSYSDPLMLFLLDVPVRVFDTRPAELPNGIDAVSGTLGDGAFSRNENRQIDVSFVLGDESKPTGVGLTSTGVLMNVAVIDTVGGSGNLKAWASAGSEPAISVLNWDRSGSKIANSVTSRHSNGYVRIKLGGPIGASAHIIVDVIGFYDTFGPI